MGVLSRSIDVNGATNKYHINKIAMSYITGSNWHKSEKIIR